MGRRKGSSTFWQSAWMNDQAFMTYRLWILTLAVNRFRWTGLPDTCDPRFLEETLALQGVATISTPPGGTVWTSTQAVTDGTPNLYMTPRRWRSFGVDGFGYDVTPSNGVLVYASRLRTPFPTGMIDMYARRLADYDRAADTNVKQQQRPWLITAPSEKVSDLVQVYKQAAGGEPAILGLKGLASDVQVEAFGMPVDLIVNELDDGKRRIWNDVYSLLGIENLTQKAERMIQDEVLAESVPTSLMALDGLEARREAARVLNSRFGMDVHVSWAYDDETKLMQAARLKPILPIIEEEGGRNAGI